MNAIKQAIEALEVAQDALDISQSLQESAKSNHHPKTLAAYERVSAALAALRSMPAEPVAWAEKAMELATDFGVCSLRLGSYERADVVFNAQKASWQTIDLRAKREDARERLRQHLFATPPTEAKPAQQDKRLHVGDSRFEGWYGQDFDPKNKGTKQQMREAYEAGMNDPIAPAQQDAVDAFTLDQLADACVEAEIPDSKYESLWIALERAAISAKKGG